MPAFDDEEIVPSLIEPYYLYLHDLVPACEHLRTTVRKAEELSLRLQGSMAGFNTPRVVCDAPGGGGKRDISSYLAYDEEIESPPGPHPPPNPEKSFTTTQFINCLRMAKPFGKRNPKSGTV